jgi:hypothetical protein
MPAMSSGMGLGLPARLQRLYPARPEPPKAECLGDRLRREAANDPRRRPAGNAGTLGDGAFTETYAEFKQRRADERRHPMAVLPEPDPKPALRRPRRKRAAAAARRAARIAAWTPAKRKAHGERVRAAMAAARTGSSKRSGGTKTAPARKANG